MTCLVGGCDAPAEARGRCHNHYAQFRYAFGPLVDLDKLPAAQWDTGIKECLRCQIRLPAGDWHGHTCGQSVVRCGVVDHYRLMVPPNPGRVERRFAPPQEPPRTELGRYCQQILDRELRDKEIAA